MKQIDVKKLLILNVPYLFLGLYATKLWQLYRLALQILTDKNESK